MLTTAVVLIAVSGIAAALFGGVGAAVVLAAMVNMSSGIGRMAFDSIVQRDAPDANQGRAFAKFETRFQLSWAIAGVIPVLFTFPGRVAFLVVGLTGVASVVVYVRSARARTIGRSNAVVPSRRATRGGRPTNPARRSPPGSARPAGGREEH